MDLDYSYFDLAVRSRPIVPGFVGLLVGLLHHEFGLASSLVRLRENFCQLSLPTPWKIVMSNSLSAKAGGVIR